MAAPDDFDPTHALDGWRAPAPAPLDLELRSLQHGSQRRGPDDAKTARLKARGYEMLDVEDVEVAEPRLPRVVPAAPVAAPGPAAPVPDSHADAPVLDLKVAAPAPAPDPQQVIASIELPRVPSPPADVVAPALDIRVAPPRPMRDPRLLTQHEPRAWIALARRLAGASAEVMQSTQGPQVHSHEPQWLCALWPPQAGGAHGPRRWPELAAVVEGETRARALQTLLVELPDEATLWEADMEGEMAMDWGLVAELVLRQDAELRPAQTLALTELVAAERVATLAQLAGGYVGDGRVARRKA